MRSCILLLAFWPLAAMALVEIDLETSTPKVDQPFHISYSARGERLVPPDLSPLQRDFRILGRRVARNSHSYNGRRETFVELDLTLSPTHGGTLEIPPLDFGAERSDAVRLQVGDVRPVANDNPGNFEDMPWPGNPDPFGMGGMPMEMPPEPNLGPAPAQGPAWPPANEPVASTPSFAPMPTPSRKVRYDPGPWPWLAAFAFTGWVATAIAWWLLGRRRRLRSKASPAGTQPLVSRIAQAAATGDPEEARSALMAWARARWPESPPSNLRLLAARCPPLLQTHLLRLDNALSRAGGAGWSDPDLGDLITRFEKGEL